MPHIDSDAHLRISEIFFSLQGETSRIGLPTVFIRLTGCPLRCTYCDTTYAYEEGIELSEDEIVDKVKAIGIHTVEITGGEPLLRKEVFHLTERLLDDRYRVLIETNGSQDIRGIDERAVIILDIKTPGSGMADTLLMSNLTHLKPIDEVKFVITGREDYEWAKRFIGEHFLPGMCILHFSPASGLLDPQTLSKWMIDEKFEVRLNLQLHKYIYGADRRGV